MGFARVEIRLTGVASIVIVVGVVSIGAMSVSGVLSARVVLD